MKTEVLKEAGLTDEQIKLVMAENGKDVNELKKTVEAVEKERDAMKERAELSEATLKKFDGIDPEKMTEEIEQWKTKAEEAEKQYKADLEARDYEDAMKEAMEGIEFTSESARKAVMSEIREAGLKVSNKKLLGFNDLLDQIKERDKTAFVDKEQKQLEEGKAKFTDALNKGGSGGGKKLTKEEILKVPDRAERRKLIAENMDLFQTTGE